MSEEQLISGIREGKLDAQRELYNRYAKKFYPVCLRYLSNNQCAQDALQDAFINIFRHIGQYRGDGSLEGWMRRVVVTTCLRALRNRKVVEIELTHETENESTADVQTLSHLAALDLLKLIQSLPDGYREVFNLHAIEGLSHQEVAEMLNISVANSKVRLNRARHFLQSKLERINALP